MPVSPPRPCRMPGCPYTVTATRQCPDHPKVAWEGSTRRNRLPQGWFKLRKQILIRDNYTCYVCGQQAKEVDHIQRGDNHDPSNLAAICTPCHRKKSGREGGSHRRYQ